MTANTFWATTFVEQLSINGISTAVIAPGSRSTPLTMAFAAHPKINVYSILDERGAAFFALGTGLNSSMPAALVCTSGTATANFYPAVIEANLARVPLLLLTADRPHDVRSSGANQSVDQVKIFSSHVRWFQDVAPPESFPQPRTVRYLSTLATRAVASATGHTPGPVHLNFPFRKPLEPDTPLTDQSSSLATTTSPSQKPSTIFEHGHAQLSQQTIANLTSTLRHTTRGLIVCGPRCPSGDFPAAVQCLAKVTGYPILADALSGLRFCSGAPNERNHVLGGYEIFLSSYAPEPDLILRFGAIPVSHNLQELLENSTATQIMVAPHGVWEDPTHNLNQWLWADEALLCRTLSEQSIPRLSPYIAEVVAAETAAWNTVSALAEHPFAEAMVLPTIVNSLPEGSNLVIANSLPVRHLDHLVRPQTQYLRVFCNRGASGIDGTVATASGVAARSNSPMVVVLGDLAMYHDLNSLQIFQRCNISGTVVVINNNGGGIFRGLPIARHEPHFTDLFLTPHGLHFQDAASMFGLHYRQVHDNSALTNALYTSINSQHTTLIEVITDSSQNRTVSNLLSETFQDQYLSDR